MGDKYYTPDIAEFHVGFEYKMDVGTGWSNQIYPSPWWYNGGMGGIKTLENCIKDKIIKVKYLNEEDILDLDFKKVSIISGFYIYEKDKFYLDFSNKTIMLRYKDDKDLTLFVGEIKNKSELKKLLKQVNCI